MKKLFFLIALVGFLNSKAQMINVGQSDVIAISTGFNTSDPADNTNYVFGAALMEKIPATVATRRAAQFPFNVTCIGASIVSIVAGTLGTVEASTVNIVVNTTTTTVLAGIQYNAIEQNYSVGGLNIPIPAGTTWEGNYLTPTWSTNPTTVGMNVIYYFRRD